VNGLAFPNIDPVAFALGPIAIRWYALAYIAGLFGGLLYAKSLAARDSLWGAIPRPSAADLDDLLLYATLGVILGGRLAYVFFYQPGYFLGKPLEIFAIWSGGMSFHGGMAGAAGCGTTGGGPGMGGMPIFCGMPESSAGGWNIGAGPSGCMGNNCRASCG
jgi:prolipoprotein diacylglyceryl transferase